MVNSIYAKAYKEVLEIIKYFSKEDYAKIPEEVIKFYEQNMDAGYSFKINLQKDLLGQNISQEASAVLLNLFYDYIATDEQKNKIKNILNLKLQQEEFEKRKKYNPNDLFKKSETYRCIKNKISENDSNIKLNNRKQLFWLKFKEFILPPLFRKLFTSKLYH